MREDFWYASKGAGKIHGCRWTPDGEPKAVLQIVHGIAEYIERYDDFAKFLNSHGILVVAEDHMGHGQSVNGGGVQGYFHGGWFTAVEDTMALLRGAREGYPGVPYILLATPWAPSWPGPSCANTRTAAFPPRLSAEPAGSPRQCCPR